MHVSFNLREYPHTAHSTTMLAVDQLKSSRNPRAFNGATVGVTGYPDNIPAGGRIEYAFNYYRKGLPEPYHGQFALIVKGQCEAQIDWIETKLGTVTSIAKPTMVGDGFGPMPFAVPAYPADGHLRLTVRKVNSPILKMAVVHQSHTTAYANGDPFVPELARLTSPGGIVRWMKPMAAHLGAHDLWAAGYDDERLPNDYGATWSGDNSKGTAGWSWTPESAILAHHAQHGGTPWLNLGVNVSDEYAAGLANDIAAYGVPVIIELGNEIWNGSARANNPFRYAVDAGSSLFGVTPDKTGESRVARAWSVYRLAKIIDAMDAAGDPRKHLFVWADKGDWGGWLDQVFGPNSYLDKVMTPAERQRLALRLTAIAVNPYSGNDIPAGSVTPGDMAASVREMNASTDRRVSAIAGLFARAKAMYPHLRLLGYEGGIGANILEKLPDGTKRPIPPELVAHWAAFQDTWEAGDCLRYLLDRCDKAGMDALCLFSLTGERWAQGHWDHVPHMAAALNSTAKGAVVADWQVAAGTFLPFGNVTGPTLPPVVLPDPEPEPIDPPAPDPDEPEEPPADPIDPPPVPPVAENADLRAAIAEAKLIATAAAALAARLEGMQ